MAETTDEILSQIESQRARLGSNIDELETRVKDTTDWRAQFDKNPLLVMGLALGGGVLLSTLFVGGKKRGSSGYYSSSSQGALNSATAHQRNQVSQTFDQVKAALLAVGSAKLMEFLGDVVPDFQRHFQEVGEKHSSQQNASGSGVNASSSTSTHPVSSATSASVPPTSPAVSM